MQTVPPASASRARDAFDSAAVCARGLELGHRAGFWMRPRTVVHALDLELARGHCLGLLGPNGSGKTTLLRALAGLETPWAGELSVLGASPQSPRARARIGYCPEDAPFPMDRSAQACLQLVAAALGFSRSESRARCAAALERFGLGAHAQRALAHYSRGMLRRFALAQALLGEVEIALLDEPSAGLDALGLVALEQSLAELRARGASCVLCSHELADLAPHCDELLVLLDGRVALRARAGELDWARGAFEAELGAQDATPPDRERLASALAPLGLKLLALRPARCALLALYRAGATPAESKPGAERA